MPQILRYQQQTLASQNGLGPGPSAQRGRGIDALTTVVGQQIEAFRQRQQDDAIASANDEIQDARRHWMTEFERRKNEAQPGAPEFTPTLQKDFDSDVSTRLERIGDRKVKAYAKQRLGEIGLSMQENALRFEAAAREEARKAKIGNALDAAATAVELDPEQLTKVLAENEEALAAMNLPPIEREGWREHAYDLLTQQAAIGYARRDPDAAMKRFSAPDEGDSVFRALSPKGRSAVLQEIENQQRIRVTSENRARQEHERLERDTFEQTAKDGDQLLYSGKLTAGWIAANRDKLSEADVRYFYRTLREESVGGVGGAGRGGIDVGLYADLRDKAGRGEDVRSEAREALQNGRIGTGDYDRLLGEVEQERKGWYRRGTDFISTSAAVSDLNPDPAAAQRKAAMLDDWSEWADANPRASEAEASKEYRRIVSEYAIVAYNEMTLTKRAPTFLIGARDRPDIDATEAETVRAFQEGRITQAEFNKQAALIAEWRRALEAAQRTTAEGAK